VANSGVTAQKDARELAATLCNTLLQHTAATHCNALQQRQNSAANSSMTAQDNAHEHAVYLREWELREGRDSLLPGADKSLLQSFPRPVTALEQVTDAHTHTHIHTHTRTPTCTADTY